MKDLSGVIALETLRRYGLKSKLTNYKHVYESLAMFTEPAIANEVNEVNENKRIHHHELSKNYSMSDMEVSRRLLILSRVGLAKRFPKLKWFSKSYKCSAKRVDAYLAINPYEEVEE